MLNNKVNALSNRIKRLFFGCLAVAFLTNAPQVVAQGAADYGVVDLSVTESLGSPVKQRVDTVPVICCIDDECPEGLSGYIKTNILGWAMTQVNLAVEFDVARHWSLALPIYYSGMNYFTYKWKFRIFSFMPQARYWFNPCNQGWFVGAHVGVAWYDFAFGGTYRYQDHGRHTPAIGGGISAGYRFPISSNRRWWMEAEVGLGVYNLKYDRLFNVKNGALYDTQKKTKFMPDIISLTIAYRFDLQKGGNR